MGDMAEDFKFMKALKKERHAKWKEENTSILVLSNLEFKVTNNGETIIFRDTHFPKIDFYPSTGRWRIPGQKKTYSGGARAFMNWYEKQKEK